MYRLFLFLFGVFDYRTFNQEKKFARFYIMFQYLTKNID